MASICSSERAERLAIVRLRTFLPSRYDSRSRYVGLRSTVRHAIDMHGYMMPSHAPKNNHQIIFTWLHNAPTPDARNARKVWLFQAPRNLILENLGENSRLAGRCASSEGWRVLWESVPPG